MRRTITLLIGALASVSLLSACGDGDGGGEAVSETTAAAAVSEAEFCGMIQDYKDKADSFDSAFNSSDPKDIEEAFTTMQDVLHDLEDAAPDNVKSDLVTMVTTVDRMIEIFDKYDWDFTKLATAPEFATLSADLDSEEMTAASDRLDAFSQDTCGIDTGS